MEILRGDSLFRVDPPPLPKTQSTSGFASCFVELIESHMTTNLRYPCAEIIEVIDLNISAFVVRTKNNISLKSRDLSSKFQTNVL